MSNRLPQLGKPDETAPLGAYIKYYQQIKGWSQSKLALCARLNQSHLNKIINGKVYDVKVDDLVCLCLTLQINLEQSKDLLARAERALSPANPSHRAYMKLIEIYVSKPFDYEGGETMLDYADRYLIERGLPTLPNALTY